ncbi:hypothetical protein [Luteitalea sp.]
MPTSYTPEPPRAPTPYTRLNTRLTEAEHERLGELHPVMQDFAVPYAEARGRYPKALHREFQLLQAYGYVPASHRCPGLQDALQDAGFEPTLTAWEHWHDEYHHKTNSYIRRIDVAWLLPVTNLSPAQMTQLQQIADAHGLALGLIQHCIHPPHTQSMRFSIEREAWRATTRKTTRKGGAR